VGRSSERQAALAAFERAGGDEQQAVFVAGEPGIGKTALAAEVARAARDAGALVLYGRCGETAPLPYQPFVEALRQHVAAIPPGDLRGSLGARPAELVRLVPELADRLPGLVPADEVDHLTGQHRLFEAVTWWLGSAAAIQRVVLVVDDLHWASAPTVALLGHVLAAPLSHRPFVVVTYRDDAVDRGHPLRALLGELRRTAPSAVRITLEGLDEDAVAAVVRAIGGEGRVADDVARRLRTETDGNPLFVTEVVRDLLARRALVLRQGVWGLGGTAELPIPETVREVIERRLDVLGEDTAELLGAAAVLGTEFDLPGVLGLTGRSPDAVLDALDVAVRSHVVIEAAGVRLRYRFAHALVHAAVYASLSASRRTQLHARAVDALTTRFGEDGEHVGDLARHALAASGLLGASRVVTLLRAAGDRALAQLAGDQAVDWFERALVLLDDDPAAGEEERCDVLLALGTAQRWAGRPAFRETLLTAARRALELDDTARLVAAALANTRGNFSELYRMDEERVEVVRAALDRSDGADSPDRARLMVTLAVELLFGRSDDERLALADGALEMVRRVGTDRDVADVLALHLSACHTMDRMDERLRHSAELVALAEASGEPTARFDAYRNRVLVAVEAGDLDDVRRCLDGARALEGRYPQRAIDYALDQSGAYLALLGGRLDDADALSRTAFDRSRSLGHPDAYLLYGAQLVGVRRAQGRLAELVAAVDAAPDPFGVTQPYVARIHWEAGNRDRARVLWDETVAVPIDWLASVGQVAGTHFLSRAWLACRLGDVDEAARLYPVLLPWADLTLNPLEPHPATAHFLGMLATTLGRFDDAAAHFDRAAAVHERLGAPLHRGRTSIELARLLRQMGDERRAAALIEDAQALGSSLGAGELVREAAELTSAGQVL
jgi:tetratricopeptide (TPR) repeat protein